MYRTCRQDAACPTRNLGGDQGSMAGVLLSGRQTFQTFDLFTGINWILQAEPPVSRTLLRRILHFPAEAQLPHGGA